MIRRAVAVAFQPESVDPRRGFRLEDYSQILLHLEIGLTAKINHGSRNSEIVT